MHRDDLETLVAAHQAELYRYVRYLGAVARAEAEDLVQETFLAAFRSRTPPPPEERQQAAWLRGIARNLFLAHCRRRRKAPVALDHSWLERAEALWSEEFLRRADGFDYVEALRHCVGQLAGRQRQFVEMRYMQGKSRAEMARLCGMSADGIKSALQRARAVLADCVQRRLEAETV
jgi:RNA polymerase sigma-70 factor (ECF subfamily)